MTLDHQKQLLREICSEYDLETLMQAICDVHNPREVSAAISDGSILGGESLCPWEVESGKALADEVIQACQPSQH
jgi:hypothetical protein